MQQPKKITPNHSKTPLSHGRGAGGEAINYAHALKWFESRGRQIFGLHFKVKEEDKHIITGLLAYFLKDESYCAEHQISLVKGILLTGPVGCGKTTIMQLMKYFNSNSTSYAVKSCRDVSFEFIQDGYETVYRYSKKSYSATKEPLIYCFDDMGTEQSLKYYGNECNVMAEVLLSRYDLFVSRKLVTHLTTNLSATEIENLYGNRLRSRMREMFNLIAFDKEMEDKRK